MARAVDLIGTDACHSAGEPQARRPHQNASTGGYRKRNGDPHAYTDRTPNSDCHPVFFAEASLHFLPNRLKQTQRTMRQRHGESKSKCCQPANQTVHDHFLRLRADPLAYIIDLLFVGCKVHPFAVAVRTWVWQYRATMFCCQPFQQASFISGASTSEVEIGLKFI